MKLKLAATILAASLSLVTFAFAQGAAPADVALINGCLKTAEKTGGFGGACVGLVADPCIKMAKGANDDVAKMKASQRANSLFGYRKPMKHYRRFKPAGSQM